MSSFLKRGQKATLTAGAVTLLFAIAKAIVGLISGSLVLVSDAIHSGADSFSAFFAWMSIKISQREPTEKFPYGFYKAESIASLVISVLILFAGYEIVKGSISNFFTTPQLNSPLLAIGVAVLDALVMFGVGTYEIKVGKEVNLQSLVADGTESRMHLLSSLVVLIGISASWFSIPYLESIAGLVIVVLILQAGIESGKNSVFALMDVSPDKEVEEKIKSTLNSISGVKDFEELRLRKAGPFVIGEVKVRVAKSVNVKTAEEFSNRIEKKVKEKVESVDSLMIRVSPYREQKQKICLPIKGEKELDSSISPHLARSKELLFAYIEGKEIKDYYIKNNPYQEDKVRAGLKVSLFIIEEKVDTVITKEIGPISLYTLRDNIIDVYQACEGTATENIQKFTQSELKMLQEPTRSKT